MGKNKVVIISGGTSGIGLATAKILASEGWKTILLGRDMNKGRGAQEEAQGSLFIPCDVTNTRIVKNTIEKAASFGEIRGVVSCAGIYTEGLLDNVTDEEMQKFFEVNVFGTIKLLRAAVPFLRMHGGSIVTVASDAAIQGNVQCSLYSATKGLPLLPVRWRLNWQWITCGPMWFVPETWRRLFWKSSFKLTAVR